MLPNTPHAKTTFAGTMSAYAFVAPASPCTTSTRDEPRDDVRRALVSLEYAEEIATLAGAHAQDRDGPVGAVVERCGEVSLHDFQPT